MHFCVHWSEYGDRLLETFMSLRLTALWAPHRKVCKPLPIACLTLHARPFTMLEDYCFEKKLIT